MVLDDRRMKVREIAEATGISKERVGYILHEELDMKKLCPRWVPRLLTEDQKRTRMKISEQCLERFNKNKLIFCFDLLLWMRFGFTITHHNPNSSQNSGQKPVVQRQRRQGRFHQPERSWHRCFGMLRAFFIDYLERNKTITGEYYSNLLTRLDEKIREKRPGLQKKKIIFHQDNAPAHKSVLAMGKLRDLHYELLEHPLFFPDLASSDFCLFPKLKLFPAGQRFSPNQEANAAVEGYFADITKNHYRDGIMALEHCWNKCMSLNGDYVEK
jgi:histone-lysine N-methyltransferase SETMAR